MKKALVFSGKVIAVLSLTLLFQQIASYFFSTDELIFFPAIALATLFVILLFDRGKKINLGLTSSTSSPLHGALAGAILISLTFYLMKFVGALQVVDHQVTFAETRNLIYLFILFFVISFQEELLFRGYLYDLADKLYSNPKTSILTTSLLFSILHAWNPAALSSPIPLLNIFLAGLLLGLFRQYSKGIWMPISFHWSWNLLQGGYYGFPVSGISIQSILQIQPSQNHWLSGGQFGAEGSIITTLLFIGAIIGYWFFFQRTEKTIKKRTVQ